MGEARNEAFPVVKVKTYYKVVERNPIIKKALGQLFSFITERPVVDSLKPPRDAKTPVLKVCQSDATEGFPIEGFPIMVDK